MVNFLLLLVTQLHSMGLNDLQITAMGFGMLFSSVMVTVLVGFLFETRKM